MEKVTENFTSSDYFHSVLHKALDRSENCRFAINAQMKRGSLDLLRS